jgi:uncharacterized protein YggE
MENNMLPKWLVNGLGGLLIVLVAILVVQKINDLHTSLANSKPANTISVSGEGKVMSTPDLATVDIGVLTQSNTASDAESQNNTKVNQVITFIKAQGVAAADISTSQFNLSPQYDYTKGTPTITGYQVNQSVTVKIHGVDKDTSVLNKVIDGSVTNGANQVNNVSLSVENPDALQQQAQEQAIANAKTKAQALAKAAGLTLGKVVSVSESGSPVVPGPIPYALDAAMGSAAPTSVAPNIQTGSQEIDETMTVVYEVK